MRKALVVMLSLCLMTFFLSCGGGKYSDVKKINEEYIEVLEKYIAALDKSETAKDVAKAMNDFAGSMEDIMPRMRKLQEKYPELKDRKNPPEELKESMKDAEEVGAKFAASMMKTMRYMNDPDVKKAQERFAKAMTGK